MQLKENLKKVYTKEYLILIGIGFLPLLWKILEIVFLSGFVNALKILAQMVLISIIFKVFEESILNPLYKILSKNEDSNANNYLIKKFLIIYSIITLIFSAVCFFASSSILKISQVSTYIFDETLIFLKIYIVSCGFGVISKYLYTCSLISKETKKLFVYLLIKSVATAMLFLLFVPKFTLKMGVNGIALSELIINIATIIYLSTNLVKTYKTKLDFNKKEYFKLFALAFFETLIRNAVYYCVILVFLNLIDNQDLYFVANEYIWSIMLVPALAQSTLIRQQVTNKNNNLKPFFLNSLFLFAFIIILIPLALFIFKYIYNLQNYLDYFIVLLKLIPCYFIFIIDSIIESYFIASGKLHHVLIQSILTNIVVYLTAFILYLCNVISISLNLIIILFNIGVIVSSLYTICVYLVLMKRNKSSHCNFDITTYFLNK
ncbi:MAG: hypothetical protein IJ008_05560 [Clostridia bacterium]|nr:hypothetical protein [Clostridia bacterium]